MKKCRKCNRNKDKSCFYKDKSTADGFRNKCKDCDKKDASRNYYRNHEKRKARCREYYHNNREERLAYCAERYEPKTGEYKVCERCDSKYWADRHQKSQSKYCSSCRRDARLEVRREWEREKRKNDPTYRLNKNMGFMLWAGLNKKRKNGESIKQRLGYTIDELKDHLESQFKRGMNWDNYGEWHIDHIQPRTAFHFESPEDHGFKKCWALSNLQPLWDYENIEKGNG